MYGYSIAGVYEYTLRGRILKVDNKGEEAHAFRFSSLFNVAIDTNAIAIEWIMNNNNNNNGPSHYACIVVVVGGP